MKLLVRYWRCKVCDCGWITKDVLVQLICPFCGGFGTPELIKEKVIRYGGIDAKVSGSSRGGGDN